MKIEKYELTKKNYYNVYLSNGEVLTLSEKVITENELLLKKELDKETYNKVNRDNNIYNLVDMAIKYINIRLRSIKEVRDYLIKKCDSIEEIDEAICKLIKLGYLDDEKFTKAFIKDKLSFTNQGDYKIKMELQRLGVDFLIIENNVIDDDIIHDRIRKIIDKDIRVNRKYSGINLKNKIYNHLLSQGYSKEKVISIINEYSF